MKAYRTRLLFFALSLTLLSSCFKDQGNYVYDEIYPPRWIKDYSQGPETYRCYLGDSVEMDGSKLFVWETDSARRASEVRYEWVFNGEVVSTDLHVKMSVAEFMEKSKLTTFTSARAHPGTFSIIEKKNGVKFMARLQMWMNPYYSSYDWFVLSDNAGQTNVSSLRSRWKKENGKSVRSLTFDNNAYEEHNGGDKIPGKPISMNWSYARDIGSQGSITIITDQAAYELNGENLKKENDLKDLFLDGAPAGFSPILRANIDTNDSWGGTRPATFISNSDGKIYSRVMGANYLGGKFLSEPYQIDEKGYSIKMFGTGRFGGTFPCYDEKNRRIIMASTWRVDIPTGGYGSTSAYRTRLTPVNNVSGLALGGFSEKITVMGLYHTDHLTWGGNSGTTELYTIFYKNSDEPGKVFVKDFCVDNRTLMAIRQFIIPKDVTIEANMDETCLILVAGNSRSESTARYARFRTMYTTLDDNRLHYIVRQEDWANTNVRKEVFPVEFTSKITALAYDYWACDELMIGCENGDVFLYDIQDIMHPQLVFKGNTGGKVLSFRQLGQRTSYHENN